MTGLTRRAALAGAAVAVAGLPGAVQAGKPPLDDAKTREALELFGRLNSERQEISLVAMRAFLDVQLDNERAGFTTEDDARAGTRAAPHGSSGHKSGSGAPLRRGFSCASYDPLGAGFLNKKSY